MHIQEHAYLFPLLRTFAYNTNNTLVYIELSTFYISTLRYMHSLLIYYYYTNSASAE
jgi:hypothetical protein